VHYYESVRVSKTGRFSALTFWVLDPWDPLCPGVSISLAVWVALLG